MKIAIDRMPTNYLYNYIIDGGLLIPSYQREFCWNDSKIEDLIDSVMKDITLGLFQMREISHRKIEVVDGLHRIKCLVRILTGKGVFFSFEKDMFTLNANDYDYSHLIYDKGFMLFGKRENGLTDEKLHQIIDSYQRFSRLELVCITYKDGTDEEIKVAFERINQSGVQFTPMFDMVSESKVFKL